MPDVKISQLPAGTANAAAVVPATNAAGTTTEKLTVSSILAIQHNHSGGDITSGTVAAARLGTHASTHQTGGTDQIDPVIVTPSSLSSSQNNYAPGVCDILRLTSSTAIDITGLAAATADGAMRLVINTNASGGSAITLKHESASSTAANRFRNTTGGDCILPADGGSAVLTYSSAISRWRIL